MVDRHSAGRPAWPPLAPEGLSRLQAPPPPGLGASVSSAHSGGSSRSRAGLGASASFHSHRTGATSTSSSSSSRFDAAAAFAHLSDADVRFFDQVVALLSPGAASFAALKEAHNDLLAADLAALSLQDGRGSQLPEADAVEQRRQRDARLWDALLRLMHVRGRDWRERWSAVRVALGLEPGDFEDELSIVDSEDDVDVTRDSLSTAASHSVTTTSISDSGLSDQTVSPAEQQAAVFPGHSYGRGDEKAEAGMPGVPRRGQVRGRTRSPSPPLPAYEDAAISTDRVLLRTRARTEKSAAATPLAQQHHQRAFRPLPRRAHLLSEESGTDESGASSADAASPAAPRALRGAAQRHFAQVMATGRERRAAAASERAEAEEAADLRAAEAHHARSLLARCFGWWATNYEQKRAQLASIAKARDIVLLTRAWEYWRARALPLDSGDGDAADAERRKQERLARKADEVRAKLSAWRRWKRLAAERKEQRTEARRAELKHAYRQIVRRRSERIARQALARWKQGVQRHMADDWHEQRVAQRAFASWKIRAAQHNVMAARERALLDSRGKRLVRDAFDHWAGRTQLHRLERQVVKARNDRLGALALSHWRRTATLHSLQTAFERHRLLTGALSRWREACDERRQQRRSEVVAARRADRLLKRRAFAAWRERAEAAERREAHAREQEAQFQRDRKAALLRKWRLAARERAFTDHSNAQLVQRAFGHWQQHLQTMKEDLAACETSVSESQKTHLLRSALHCWAERTKTLRTRSEAAEAAYEAKLKGGALAAWRSRAQECLANQQKAVLAERFMLERRSLDRWRSRLLDRRGAELQETFALRRLQSALEVWRGRAAWRRHERLAVSALQSRIEDRIQRQALATWTSRTVEVKSKIMEVTEARDKNIVHRAMASWKRAMQRSKDREDVLREYQRSRDRDTLSQALLYWRSAAHLTRERRLKVRAFRERQARRVLQSAWDRWEDSTHDRRLRDIEYAVLLRRRMLALEQIMARWVDQTSALPAIRYRNTVAKQRLLQQWREALYRSQARRAAVEFDQRQLVSQAFAAWKHAARQRRALRSAARFGGASSAKMHARSIPVARRASRFVSNPPADTSVSRSFRAAPRPVAFSDRRQRDAPGQASLSHASFELDDDLRDM